MDTVFLKTRTELGKERMGFSLFLAIAIHILLIFGIGFTVFQLKPSSHSIDITLANYQADQAPEDADFIAQSDQLGSGNLDNKEQIATDVATPLESQTIQQVHQQTPAALPESDGELLTTVAPSDKSTAPASPQPGQPVATETPKQSDNLAQSDTLASLKARLDTTRQAYSKLPKIRRLTSISTKAADEAAYLFYWVQRAEQIGNQHYPEEARRKSIYGELQLAVTLLPDGSIENIDIIRSSGHQILDLAAIRTVRLASPFAPFYESMRQFDQYEIIRTWRYLSGNTLTTDQ